MLTGINYCTHKSVVQLKQKKSEKEFVKHNRVSKKILT